MTAFQPTQQDAFAFPQIEVAIQLPERSLEQKIEGAVQAITVLIEQGWHPVVAWSGGKDSCVTLNLTLTALLSYVTFLRRVPLPMTIVELMSRAAPPMRGAEAERWSRSWPPNAPPNIMAN